MINLIKSTSYNEMINKIYKIKEDELKVLLDKLYFYDKGLYRFKEIFTAATLSDSSSVYNFFVNDIKYKNY